MNSEHGGEERRKQKVGSMETQIVPLPVAVLAEPFEDDGDGRHQVLEDEDAPILFPFANLRGRNMDTISSYLFDMIREERSCSLAGWSSRSEGCDQVVSHCSEHSDEAFYKSLRGRTPLHEACLRGSCGHIVEALLDANSFGATDRDNEGNTALHLSFVDFSTRSIINPQGRDSFVSKLLNVNPSFMAMATNLAGNTALHMACFAPETTIDPSSLAQLLKANPSCASKLNNKRHTPLHLHCQRRNASTRVAKILLEANPEALYVLDGEDGWAPLHYAVSNVNFELIQFLVETNPDAASVRTTQGLTSLHLLCRVPNLAVEQLPAVDVLLRADPGSATRRDASPNTFTPLHLLCRVSSRVSLDVLERLLETSPGAAGIPDSEHYLPLHHACEIGCDSQIISALLRSYPSAAYAMTRKQDSALSLACSCNKSVETVRLLIEANPGALVKKNDYGFAPLHCVCRAHHPREGIVKALLNACPACITLKTHGGETPVHLACSNLGAFVGVLHLLATAQNKVTGDSKDLIMSDNKPMTNKVGNTPRKCVSRNMWHHAQKALFFLHTQLSLLSVHDACFRSSPFEHIETLATTNPEWVSIHNNGGYSPLQILCKNGRIDERIVTIFSSIGGPEIFSVVDSTGNTPLHSAMREDMDVNTLKCLIRARPGALHLKTIYGDSPLHLACFRRASPDVIRELILASSNGRLSPVLETNSAGQTPIGIAMEEFRSVCRGGRFCCVISEYGPEQRRSFQVLATLVNILHYGPSRYKDHKQLSLVRASVGLHRQNVRLDPAFIRRAIHLFPEETCVMDEDGNYPLHIEASIPVEKMSLLDATAGCCSGCHKRMGILRMLLQIHPDATKARNASGQFPLGLMLQNGRMWGDEVALALRAFPPALHWYKELDDRILAKILEKASKECGADTIFSLLSSRPDIFSKAFVAKR